ncbi:hypothetical protein [Bradyrhizobium septentrionale]|uniref:Uncharacterized protein n=1 Tax=Bradyrhizobium septentrionale TaxID=1404411 RepID=A0A974A4I8_9BRAD|nr:hypothetical protein [Bradyrhizobium septentrionale]UGY18159.1 hypothetical protein HAP48_0012415 [Bradyrhizobium septentrionale]UGY26860.1 hypothetical protein HU675_0008980 [Bradyrhizobium septentrionale]
MFERMGLGVLDRPVKPGDDSVDEDKASHSRDMVRNWAPGSIAKQGPE